MNTTTWVVVAAVVIVVIGVALLIAARIRSRSTTAALRSRFGPEYDRVVERYGRRDGEKELRNRLRLRDRLDVRALDPEERDRYEKAWESAQAAFVETPSSGLRDADLLVQQVMRDRGYPVETFEEREKLISVDHPDLVERYRSAHGVAVDNENDDAGTEEMRRAMNEHRYVFDALLAGGSPEHVERTRRT